MTNYILSQFLYESKNSTIDIINRIAFLFFRFKISKRIGTLSILPDFKMQVVSGRIAGGTDISDHFPLFHFLTYGHADRGAVGIQGVKSIIVAYLDMIACLYDCLFMAIHVDSHRDYSEVSSVSE